MKIVRPIAEGRNHLGYIMRCDLSRPPQGYDSFEDNKV